MKRASFVIAVLVVLGYGVSAAAEAAADGSTVAPPSAPAPAANQPPYAYPPGYAYPPPGYANPPAGYGYPPGYAYPPPYGYPQPYPGYYPAPTVARPAPPFEPPTGQFRLGASVGLFLGGRLNYKLLFRGEPLVAHSASAAATPGLAVFAEYQPLRYVFVGFTVQYLTTVKWSQSAPVASSSDTTSQNPYGGTGHEIDLLPRLGFSYPLTPRVRLLASGAPGYSRIDASSIVKIVADPGTVSGFTIQGDAGALISFSQHGFVQGRLSYQASFLENDVTSPSTGEAAKADLHASYWAVNAGIGYWF